MKFRSLRSRFALLCAVLVALTLVLFAALSAGLYYHEQLEAFSQDHTRVPSKAERREAFEGLMTLLSCDAVLLPAAAAVAAAIAWASGRRLLAGLSGLADAADGITIGNLDRRIPEAGTADEVARLTQAFNALLERLERSVLNIKRFTADASHEFRMPLTLMKCEVESLLRHAEKGVALEESFERLLLEIHHLDRLCDSLLFLTRADAGAVRITPEPVDLAALCHELLEDVEALAEPAGIRVENGVPSGIHVRGDPLLTRRLLLNLLDNALKYNYPGGWIRASASNRRTGVTLRIENSAPQIPAPERGRLFQRFHRTDAARHRETGGVGLGLSICREIVHLHGGRIRLAQSTAEGTCFEVTLPAAPDTNVGGQPPVANPF
ncbi:MAG: HAMP domain-containing protein [Verrucomicrobia bacterium]|nr:HAMP domain-containing protein [Verrucomicrobiota bacterium]